MIWPDTLHLLHMQAAATSRQGLLSFWWRVRAFDIISYHFISFLAASLHLIWRNDLYADKWYCSIFVRLAASELYHLHLRSVCWMNLDIPSARKNWHKAVWPHVYSIIVIYTQVIHTCIYIYNTILWPHHLTQPKFTHTSKSVWNVIFQAVLYGPWSRRNCNCVDSKQDILYQEDSYKFLMSTRNLGFRLLGFHHWVQWRGAKTVSKECWGPCHGLIPSLWDFAQNYSPQIERRDQNWRGTIYPLDSEKAIEPCISAVTDCQPRFAQGQPNGYFHLFSNERTW